MTDTSHTDIQTPAVDYSRPIREHRNGTVVFSCPAGHGPMQIRHTGGAEAYECRCGYGYDPEHD